MSGKKSLLNNGYGLMMPLPSENFSMKYSLGSEMSKGLNFLAKGVTIALVAYPIYG